MNITIADDVLYRELAGESVLLNLASGVYFGLDDVGTRMWYLLAEHGDPEKILPILLAEYEVEATKLRQDVETLIRQLVDKGLVKIEP